jgi:hypothetical protein
MEFNCSFEFAEQLDRESTFNEVLLYADISEGTELSGAYR